MRKCGKVQEICLIFWSFFEILEYFGHFHFSGILVILVIELGFTHNNWVGLNLS